MKIYLKSTHKGQHFGYHFVCKKQYLRAFHDVHPVLPEVYTSVVGLHSVSLLISLFICIVVRIPTVLCKLLGGWCMQCYSILFIFKSIFKSKF